MTRQSYFAHTYLQGELFMDNRIFTRKDKTLNTIYRIILFACLAASAVTVYGILNVVIADNQNNLGKKILGMMIMTYGYYAVHKLLRFVYQYSKHLL